MTIFFFTLIPQLGSQLPIRYFHTYKYVRRFLGKEESERERERGGAEICFGGKASERDRIVGIC